MSKAALDTLTRPGVSFRAMDTLTEQPAEPTMAEIRAAWSARMRARRLELGLRLDDIAAAVGVTRQAVYEWEHGVGPGPLRQHAIAKVLKVRPGVLFRLTTDQP